MFMPFTQSFFDTHMRMENNNILFAYCTERENAFKTCKY